MAARPPIPGVTGATTRASWQPVARRRRGELVRSLRPSMKHLVVPLDAELPQSPHQRLRIRRRVMTKASGIIGDQLWQIAREIPDLVEATRGLARKHAVLRDLSYLVALRCRDEWHQYPGDAIRGWIQQMLAEIGPEPPARRRLRRSTRRGLEILDGGRP